MNTSKQVNMMLGLLFLVVIALGLYFVWDINFREGAAANTQVEKNAERGAFLFARNCRVCHGIQGGGVLENQNLPGTPLNLESYRPIDPDTGMADTARLAEIQRRFTDTIACGRVGTLMPPWSQAQGGPLTDFQIEQLVTLITGAQSTVIPDDINAASEKGWEEAMEFAEHDDELGKHLAAPVNETVAILSLDDAKGLATDTFLRIEEEVMMIVGVPPSSELSGPVQETDGTIPVRSSDGFRHSMVIAVGDELMRVVSVDEGELGVERGLRGTETGFHVPRTLVFDTNNDIVVERGAFSTSATAHDADVEVFAGPIEPPSGIESLTGAGDEAAPCGQRNVAVPAPGAPAPAPSEGQPVAPPLAQPVSGDPVPLEGDVLEIDMADNIFVTNNVQLEVGQEVTLVVNNVGRELHNFRVAGLDGEWNTEDDIVAPSDGTLLEGEMTGEGTFVLNQEATLVFRCDVHPNDMWGQISVVSP